MDPRFHILEHPSDVGIEAYGNALGELFENAALGLFSIIAECPGIHAKNRLRVEVKSTDVENLLVRWLSEILYIYDAEDFLLSKVEVEQISETSLRAFVFGELYDSSRHVLHQDVKAVTYHQLKVEKKDIWKARVFFDV